MDPPKPPSSPSKSKSSFLNTKSRVPASMAATAPPTPDPTPKLSPASPSDSAFLNAKSRGSAAMAVTAPPSPTSLKPKAITMLNFRQWVDDNGNERRSIQDVGRPCTNEDNHKLTAERPKCGVYNCTFCPRYCFQGLIFDVEEEKRKKRDNPEGDAAGRA